MGNTITGRERGFCPCPPPAAQMETPGCRDQQSLLIFVPVEIHVPNLGQCLPDLDRRENFQNRALDGKQ